MTNVVLAIDTATPAVTAGIVRRDGDRIDVLAERVTVDARAHAEQLTPNVLAALADAGITVTDLDTVVVGCGPGPFTGLRVGMATAAAYGQALGIPCARRVQPGRDRHRHRGRGARRHRRPPPRGVLGALPRRRAHRRARGQRARRCADRALARSPVRPTTPRCSPCRGSPRSTRRHRAWCGSSTGRRRRSRWSRCICAAPMPSRGQRWWRRHDRHLRRTEPGRRRAVRGTRGATVRRRRPVARRGVPARARRQAHPLRRRARR